MWILCLCLPVSGQPMVVIEVGAAEETIAVEASLAAAATRKLIVLGVVVSGGSDAAIKPALDRYQRLVNQSQVGTPQSGSPFVAAGATGPLSTYVMSRSDGSMLMRPMDAATAVASILGSSAATSSNPIYFVTTRPLTTVAYALLKNPVYKDRLAIIGPLGNNDPAKVALSDRRAWETLIDRGVPFTSWIPQSKENVENADSLGARVAFHPSQLSRIPYGNQWLMRMLWEPHAQAGFFEPEESIDDPLLLGLSLVLNPKLASNVSTYNLTPTYSPKDAAVEQTAESPGVTQETGPHDAESESVDESGKIQEKKKPEMLKSYAWKLAVEGNFRWVKAIDADRAGADVMSTFRRWGYENFQRVRRQVFIDGDFANGITDLSVVMRSLYDDRFSVEGYGVSSFYAPTMNFWESIRTGNSRVSLMLYNEVQLNRRVYLGLPSMRAASQASTAFFEAPNEISRLAQSQPPGQRLQVLVTGPLTNIAMAIQSNPSLAWRMHIWMMGGKPERNGAGWSADTSYYRLDPNAYQLIMQCPGLIRTILPESIKEPWILKRSDLEPRIAPFADGGWRFVGNYWMDFLSVLNGQSIGLDRNQANFNEVALLEAFIDPDLVDWMPAGFDDLNRSGGTWWITEMKAPDMNRRFIDAVNSRRF
ncbi:MAG: nucleoside hydrolase [Verrucomicrobia bacterium]|nr:nucleoside hydrolase [Verrucomicrobiota bacterium]